MTLCTHFGSTHRCSTRRRWAGPVVRPTARPEARWSTRATTVSLVLNSRLDVQTAVGLAELIRIHCPEVEAVYLTGLHSIDVAGAATMALHCQTSTRRVQLHLSAVDPNPAEPVPTGPVVQHRRLPRPGHRAHLNRTAICFANLRRNGCRS